MGLCGRDEKHFCRLRAAAPFPERAHSGRAASTPPRTAVKTLRRGRTSPPRPGTIVAKPSRGSCLGQSQDRGEAEPFLLRHGSRQRRDRGRAPCPLAPPAHGLLMPALPASAETHPKIGLGAAKMLSAPAPRGFGEMKQHLRGSQGPAASLLQTQSPCGTQSH